VQKYAKSSDMEKTIYYVIKTSTNDPSLDNNVEIIRDQQRQ